MVASGLRIFNAYPAFARRGETFCCYPFERRPIPASLTFGGWLAGARNWHFAMMWVLGLNGLVYLAFIYLHGEWRDCSAPRICATVEMVKFTSRERIAAPGKHNLLQRWLLFVPLVGIMAIVTGSRLEARALAPLNLWADRRGTGISGRAVARALTFSRISGSVEN
jgi:thiosulfate reductase cytochrome b subunit